MAVEKTIFIVAKAEASCEAANEATFRAVDEIRHTPISRKGLFMQEQNSQLPLPDWQRKEGIRSLL